jgi:uncharacterized phage-associated protein
MTTAIEVASYIKQQANVANYDTKKLQKLVYFSQAWALAWTGKPLFREDFQAWPDGPVVRSLYAKQKYEIVPVPADDVLSPDQKDVVDSVLAHYGHLSFTELIDLTHAHTPWLEARGDLPPSAPSQTALNESTIRDYYTRLAIADADSPQRRSQRQVLSAEKVNAVGIRQAEKWRAGLDILART